MSGGDIGGRRSQERLSDDRPLARATETDGIGFRSGERVELIDAVQRHQPFRQKLTYDGGQHRTREAARVSFSIALQVDLSEPISAPVQTRCGGETAWCDPSVFR